jgi:hypothetical protein
MSFQLPFLGYYSIKSPQLKKQTHSVKRRNWSHRERKLQADGPRWTAEADGFWWTAIADGPRRTALEDSPGGRPTASPSAGGRPWDRRTRPWTSGRVTTLNPSGTPPPVWPPPPLVPPCLAPPVGPVKFIFHGRKCRVFPIPQGFSTYKRNIFKNPYIEKQGCFRE